MHLQGGVIFEKFWHEKNLMNLGDRTFSITCYLLAYLMMLLMMVSCGSKKEVELECISNYIFENIENDKIEKFTSLDGSIVWFEGWEELTWSIAEDHHIIENCGIRQYVAQFNLCLDEVDGQIFFVYSVHYYLKYGSIDYDVVFENIDSAF